MQLYYGNYAFDPNASHIVGGVTEFVKNEGGQSVATRQSLDVKTYISGDGQADITQKMNALATALAVPFQDLILFRDDGQPSGTGLSNLNSITGVRITSGPKFTKCEGGTYSSYQYAEFSAEAEYPLPESALMLLSFHESLTFEGGGPITIYKLAINGFPQKQLVYPASVYRVVQRGEASGYLDWPAFPAPIWPGFQAKVPGKRDRHTPKRRGNGYSDFRISWEYEFESAVPLIGLPNFWL